MITLVVRKESYEKSKPEFNNQEQLVMSALEKGYTDAWTIARNYEMLITSVRRALNNLWKIKKVIEPTGKVWNRFTSRYVTEFKIVISQQTLFKN